VAEIELKSRSSILREKFFAKSGTYEGHGSVARMDVEQTGRGRMGDVRFSRRAAMKIASLRVGRIWVGVVLAATGFGWASAVARGQGHGEGVPAPGVTVTDNGRSWTLDNGIVKATVNKDSGSMPSLLYHGFQTMAASGGTWEHSPQGAPQLTNSVTIDPATNGGARSTTSATS